MTREQLIESIRLKQTFLCIGLDSDIDKIPQHLLELDDPVFEFNKAIVDYTHDLAIAYKPNLAFYESRGAEGWKSLEKTIEYISDNYAGIFTIADAKRGDIGNTSGQYAKAFFENMSFSALTVAPYMGEDSISPFLAYDNKWVILLALTSNKGASDFQYFKDNDKRLFEEVISISGKWANHDHMMYVVGATKAEMLKDIRKLAPDHFLLVPGVGAQGGSLEEVVKYGMNKECGLIVNSSRGIIFASNEKNFADVAREKAREIQLEMAKHLIEKDVI